MTLRTSIAENFNAVFTNVDHFAESMTYLPATGGPPATISGLVTRTRDLSDASDGFHEVEELIITISKDEAATTGGRALVALGDRVRLAVDPPDKLFSFTGEVLADKPHLWKLRMRRQRPEQVGREQTRS